MTQPPHKIWSEKWRLASLTREELIHAAVGALIVGALFILFHALGNTADVKLYGRSTLLWMIGRWNDGGLTLGAADYSHGWLIPIVSLCVIWWKRQALMQAPKAPSRMGLAVVMVALFLHWFGAKAQLPRLSLVALVALIWGIPFYLYGRQVAKLLLFPCAYLFFCIPINFLDSLTLPLRVYMTTATHVILTGLGFAIVQSGTALHSVISMNAPVLLHPDNIKYSLEIADPCSGVRSLTAMVAITAIYGYLTQRTLLRKWILFLSAVPLALLGNMIRILTVSLVSEAFGGNVGAGIYHDFAGYLIFMAITIPLMILLGQALDADWKTSCQRWKETLLSPTS